MTDETYTGLGPETDPAAWRHTIPVIDGVIHEQHDDKILAKWLWLQEDNSSNVRKGYMRQILKVYRLSVLVSQEQRMDLTNMRIAYVSRHRGCSQISPSYEKSSRQFSQLSHSLHGNFEMKRLSVTPIVGFF